MTLKLLCTADLHLNAKERDHYRHEFQKQLQDLARNRRVDRVIILGDLTEDKDHHPAWLVNKVVDHIKRLTRCAPVTILRGNHDYADIESPFFEFLGQLEGVKWIGKPDAHHLPGRLFLPHTRNHERDWAKLALKQFGWIFTHNTFEGALGENGRPMRGIPLSVIPGGPVVISGDVHVPQTMTPVTYVGAPYTVDFGDKFKPRVLLITDNKVESIPCTGPQKRLVRIAWPTKGADVRHLDEALKRIKTRDVVKIRVDLEPEQYDHWQSIYDVVFQWTQRKLINVCGISPELTGATAKLEPSKLRRQTDTDLMRDYVKRQGADERTLKTGDNLRAGTK